MEDTFFRRWFEGFEKGLAQIPDRERGTLLQGCAEACSRSYSLGVYRDACAKSSTLEGFLTNLKSAFQELSYRISEDRKTVTILYDHCDCDLYTKGIVTSPHLCECSRRSLKYNWEAVTGEAVEVTMKGSILRGEERCEFEVKVG